MDNTLDLDCQPNQPGKNIGVEPSEKDLHGEVDDKYNSDIEQVGQNQFRTNFLVASEFYEHIRGTNGATQNRIESETNTKISLPRVITVRRGERGDIVITGVTREAVGLARRRVDSAILDAREGLRIDHPMLDARRGRRVDSAMPAARRLTHFTCVPTQSNIKDKFLEFKQEILGGGSFPYIEESLFQRPAKLHITFFVMCLIGDDERDAAIQLLHECQEKIVRPILEKNGPIEMNVCGVACMDNDPMKVKVLYAKVESQPLQQIADDIMKTFLSAGIAKYEGRDHVKLHITLLNSKFRHRAESRSGYSRPFDARGILEKYATFDFGRQIVRNIHLSQFEGTPSDGFYEAAAVLDFQ